MKLRKKISALLLAMLITAPVLCQNIEPKKEQFVSETWNSMSEQEKRIMKKSLILCAICPVFFALFPFVVVGMTVEDTLNEKKKADEAQQENKETENTEQQ